MTAIRIVLLASIAVLFAAQIGINPYPVFVGAIVVQVMTTKTKTKKRVT